jgi:flagellar biosynthetic protein FlhB
MSEKTEAPTGKRIAEARKEGRVAISHELNTAIVLLLGAWLLSNPGKKLVSGLEILLTTILTNLPDLEITQASLRQLIYTNMMQIGLNLGMILVIIASVSVTVTLAQTGLLWASKRIGIDFNRLNPLNGFKRLFSAQGLVELAKALIKLSVVGWVAYSFLRGRIDEMSGLTQHDLASAMSWWSGMAISLTLRLGGTYLVLAVLDYAYQRWQYTNSLKMTKDEVKEEFKQQEGDPHIKSRIRGAQRRMARLRMMANVPKADVIITNPTHLAIAVCYDPQNMQAPKVLAKGAHFVAERIIQVARSHNIPVLQNIPLARALYRTVEIDQEIPAELYVAMAEVLAYVYRLRGKVYGPETAPVLPA